MEIIIHRGAHQIGGVCTEYRTNKASIIIDMGDELSLEPDFVSAPLNVDGVTNSNCTCDAVLFTHYHGDHVGQMNRVREDIPLYMGALAKEIILASAHFDEQTRKRADEMQTFKPLDKLQFGNITVTPFLVDHSASDAYMFLIEADGKRVLHTGDYRLHGFRGKGMLKTIEKYIKHVDVLVTEGTNLGQNIEKLMTEQKLQQEIKKYIEKYKYVFLLCSSTNLERICSAMHVVGTGRYFLCDQYQENLLDIIDKHWGDKSEIYRKSKCTVYGDNILDRILEKGGLMCVRDNPLHKAVMAKFPKEESIILYSLWDGYLDAPGSTLPEFLKGWHWEKLHASGHAYVEDIYKVIDALQPKHIIPMHTEHGEVLEEKYGEKNLGGIIICH